MDVILKHEPMTIPTYEPYAANTLPFFLEKKAYQGATGRIYPVPYTDRLSNKPVDKEYDSYTLENEHVKVVLLPELGGKIHGAVHSSTSFSTPFSSTVILDFRPWALPVRRLQPSSASGWVRRWGCTSISGLIQTFSWASSIFAPRKRFLYLFWRLACLPW